MDELAEHGAIRAVFEDLGGYGALTSQQGGAGPLVGHLQRTNISWRRFPCSPARAWSRSR
jgi:hypothetical protein